MVNTLPEQTKPLFTDTVGVARSVTEATAGAAETQPTELVPVTE
jgi:hypothetical protein